MTTQELKVCLCLSAIFAFRIFGLMLILPVIALYITDYSFSGALSLAIVVGAYGLAQALLQIPMGFLSDIWGRKIIIILGMSLLGIGSIICLYSHSIYGLIIGRAVQGSGAIGSTILAALADKVADKNRAYAMAILGSSIGLCFFMATMLAPLLASGIGLKGIFKLTFILAIIGIALAIFVYGSDNNKINRNNVVITSLLPQVIKSWQLVQVYFGIWSLHAVYTIIFLFLPSILTTNLLIPLSQHWVVYGIALLSGVLLAVPLIILVTRCNKFNYFFVAAILLLISSIFLFDFTSQHKISIILALTLFFAGFTFLESVLPSLASKYAPIAARGTVMGLFSSCQFFGIFSGAFLVGLLQKMFALEDVFLVPFILLLLWLAIFATVDEPEVVESNFNFITDSSKLTQLEKKLLEYDGVIEVFIATVEKRIYVKHIKRVIPSSKLQQILECL